MWTTCGVVADNEFWTLADEYPPPQKKEHNLKEVEQSAALEGAEQVVAVVEAEDGAQRRVAVGVALGHQRQVQLDEDLSSTSTDEIE